MMLPKLVVTIVRFNPLRLLLAATLLGFLGLAPGLAQQRGAGDRDDTSGPGVLSLLPADAVTKHVLKRAAGDLAYTATAGTLSLFDQNGEHSASIFYTAYALDGAPADTRPVTFVFNGGPGAASAYLHLGLLGPQTVAFDGGKDPAGARLSDNPDTWLAFTDLVMIDPVGTGWSRAARSDKADQFWSVGADAQSLAKVIALYSAKNHRMASPKFLTGESYGGFRSVKVARNLQRDQGIFVSGLVMLSPFLEGPLLFGSDRFALNAALQLPSLAAAELDRHDSFSTGALDAAEHFALTDYLTTLAGKPPEGAAADAFYGRVARMTGLPVDVVARSHGFIGDDYAKRTKDGAGIVSPYDGASLAADPFPESASDDGADPILDGYTEALGGLFAGYARDNLGFKTDITFTLLNREISRKWDWEESHSLREASTDRDLRELLAANPKLKILIGQGRSDLVTPFSISRYLIDHLPPIGGPDRIDLKLYRGGHMFYLGADSKAAFTADAKAFYLQMGR